MKLSRFLAAFFTFTHPPSLPQTVPFNRKYRTTVCEQYYLLKIVEIKEQKNKSAENDWKRRSKILFRDIEKLKTWQIGGTKANRYAMWSKNITKRIHACVRLIAHLKLSGNTHINGFYLKSLYEWMHTMPDKRQSQLHAFVQRFRIENAEEN